LAAAAALPEEDEAEPVDFGALGPFPSAADSSASLAALGAGADVMGWLTGCAVDDVDGEGVAAAAAGGLLGFNAGAAATGAGDAGAGLLVACEFPKCDQAATTQVTTSTTAAIPRKIFLRSTLDSAEALPPLNITGGAASAELVEPIEVASAGLSKRASAAWAAAAGAASTT